MHGPATIGFMNTQSEVAKQQRLARAMNAPKQENGKGEAKANANTKADPGNKRAQKP